MTGPSGTFIVFEGGEGAGKSTQVERLAAHLRDSGRTVLVTREPGGTPTAESVRALLLDSTNAGMDSRAEALLFAAARAQHVAELIRPALERGDIVICDRFIDSSVAYQGLGRDLGADKIRELSAWATGGLVADLTIVLDIDPTQGLARAKSVGAPDRMESEDLAFHQMVREAFVQAAVLSPDRYEVIDALTSPDDVEEQICRRVLGLLN